MVKIKSMKIFEIDIALKEPFKISFQTFTHINNLIVLLESRDGLTGCGEAAPFKPITGDSRNEAKRFLQLSAGRLIGREISSLVELHNMLRELEVSSGLRSQTAKTALDMAYLCLKGKIEGKPIYKLLGQDKPRIIKNTLTVGIKSLKDTVETVKQYVIEFGENGLSRIKLKLSGDPKDDVERVIKVGETFDGDLTLDANQAYVDADLAVKTFQKMHDALGDRIILIEEPSPKGDLQKMKYIKEHSEIPIFADESAATFEDAKRVVSADAADGINIKLQKAGGIYWGAQIAELAIDNGLKLMTGCMLETGISIAAGIHFACSTKGMINTDLDSDLTLPVNIVKEPSPFRDGARIPFSNPGLGVEIKPEIRNILNDLLRITRVF